MMVLTVAIYIKVSNQLGLHVSIPYFLFFFIRSNILVINMTTKLMRPIEVVFLEFKNTTSTYQFL